MAPRREASGLGRKVRVCVLHPSLDGCTSVFDGLDPPCTPQVYDNSGHYEWSNAQIRKASAAQQVRDLSRQGFDVFLNLCDGAFDEERAGLEVVSALDRYGCAYTGANTTFYEPSKELMKKMAYYYDIPTPLWAFVYNMAELEAAVSHLRYPLIAKHYNGYSSVGMGRDSKVSTYEELTVQVEKFILAYGGALVEEFITGREFTVLVSERGANELTPVSPTTAVLPQSSTGGLAPAKCSGLEGFSAALDAAEAETTATATAVVAQANTQASCSGSVTPAVGPPGHLRAEAPAPVSYLPVECVFGGEETFKHFDLKWKEYDSMRWVACTDPDLEQRLRETATLAFTALRGCSYGRCDFRVDSQGHIFFLEINPNCGLFYPPEAHGSADVILSLDPATSHQAFLHHIIAAALQRHAARQKITKVSPQCGDILVLQRTTNVKFRPGKGYGLYAARAVAEGEVVVAYEERPHVLVTLQHVERHWPANSLRAQWFQSFAYPLTPSTWVTWSDDPDDWLPINHSCDPNTWLVGLDLVARRPIAAGEHITCEYATFNVGNMPPFACTCGAATCRGRVTGQDYLSDWIGVHYSGHVSEYVATQRQLQPGGAPVSRPGAGSQSDLAAAVDTVAAAGGAAVGEAIERALAAMALS